MRCISRMTLYEMWAKIKALACPTHTITNLTSHPDSRLGKLKCHLPPSIQKEHALAASARHRRLEVKAASQHHPRATNRPLCCHHLTTGSCYSSVAWIRHEAPRLHSLLAASRRSLQHAGLRVFGRSMVHRLESRNLEVGLRGEVFYTQKNSPGRRSTRFHLLKWSES
jgi:hypothetical protein